ncbi:MAG: hypothetical protein HZB73_00420 [Nitrosarchaeum sp.]|nr:hypothetical protein [Nitrosarchaeum sp.]
MKTSNKNIVVISTITLFIVVGVIIISPIKDVQAHDTDWNWTVDSDCINASGRYVCNIPADAKTAHVLIPDLREAIPQQIGLQNAHQKTTLRISTSVANTGDGQWQMRSENPATQELPQLAKQQLLLSDGTLWKEYTVSQFEYHPAHKHFHIAAVTSYELYTATGSSDTEPITKTNIGSQKVTFCLIDWIKISDNSPNNERAYSNCDGQFQGVSPGWMDQYHQELEGQELDVTNVPTGYYFLVVTANPEHNFIEKDFTNNQAWILIHYNNDDKGNPKLEILNQSECLDYPGLCKYSPNR